MNISLISLNTSCLNNDTIELYALTIVGHFDGTPYHQGLAILTEQSMIRDWQSFV